MRLAVTPDADSPGLQVSYDGVPKQSFEPKLKGVEAFDQNLANLASESVKGMQAILKSYYNFYNAYDPPNNQIRSDFSRRSDNRRAR